MTINYTYMQAISAGFPNVSCSKIGSDNSYESIVWESGDPLPTKEYLDIWILNAVKQAKWNLIQAERDRRKAAGALVGSNWFHSDDTSRIQFLGLLMYGQSMPPGIMWKTMSGSFIEMTPTIAQQIFGTIANKDTAIFTVAEQRKAYVYSLTSVNDIIAYNHLSGTPTWPSVYGE